MALTDLIFYELFCVIALGAYPSGANDKGEVYSALLAHGLWNHFMVEGEKEAQIQTDARNNNWA